MAKLYVAYGSNLNMRQMRGRCHDSVFIGTGKIENYELQFKGTLYGAHATIAHKDGASVPVGVWKISKRDEQSLDYYEGWHKTGYRYYEKEQIHVKMEDGTRIKGMVYIMDLQQDFGNPSKNYYDTVRQGYLDCGLDTAVLDRAVEESMDLAQVRMSRRGMEFV